MDVEKLSPGLREAFLKLIDDPSPAVRDGLLAAFNQIGPAALAFLQDLQKNGHRRHLHAAGWFINALDVGDPVADFLTFIRGLNYELETGSILLARTVDPRATPAFVCATLDAIAERCAALVIEPTSQREKCRVINRVLFHEWAFHGNREHYTDPRNSLIDQVLRRRKGIPLTLSLIYLLVADRLGIRLEPVGLPGHFIVGDFTGPRPYFIDPFDRGVFFEPHEIAAALPPHHPQIQPEQLVPTPLREVLARACLNLANHCGIAQDSARAQLFQSFVDEFAATYERNRA